MRMNNVALQPEEVILLSWLGMIIEVNIGISRVSISCAPNPICGRV